MSPRQILVSTIAAVLFSQSASALDLYWDGTGTSWNSLSSWSTVAGAEIPDPLAIPGATDLAIFNISTLNTNQVINLDANQAASGLSVLSIGTVTIQGGDQDRSLALGTQGIVLGANAGALTIGSATVGQQAALSLQGSQTWANNGGATSVNQITVLNGVSLGVAGSATLTLGGNTSNSVINTISGPISDGAGVLSVTMAPSATTNRWILSGANTYSGLTTVSGGALRISHASALGSATAGTLVAAGAGLFLENAGTVVGESLTVTGDGPSTAAFGALQALIGTTRWTGNITVNTGTTTGRIGAVSSSTLIIDGTVTGTGTGQLVFQTGNSGTNSGIIQVNGNISYPGQRLTKSTTGASSGTLILNGTNNYGDTIISSGVVQIGTGGITGTLGSGPVALNAGTLNFRRSDAITISNNITGAGSIAHSGTGIVTLNGINAISGGTTINGGGTLLLDFTGLTTPTNLTGTGMLSMTGSKLAILGKASGTTSQSFNGITIAAGPSSIGVDSGTGIATNVSLGGFTRAVGGTLELTLPTNGNFSTTQTNANGIIGGYVIAGKSSWATVDGSNNIVPLPSGSYSTDLTATDVNLDVPNGGGTLSGAPNSVRFNDAAANTITLSALKTIPSGGILVTPNVGANLSQISGNFALKGPDLSDLVVFQNNTEGGLTINSPIGSSITKSGPGLLTLNGGNGGNITTRINEGTLSVSNASNLGSQGGTVSIVFPTGSTGTLRITGDNTWSSSKGFTLTGNAVIDVPIAATFTATNHAAGAGTFTKVGAGTLIYSNPTNASTYTGATIINGGAIQVNQLANGGVNSAIGAATSDASNLVLNGGGLKYAAAAGASSSTDRLFTLGVNGGTLDASGAAGASVAFTNIGAIGLSGANTARTLTLTGTNTDVNLLSAILGDSGSGLTSLLKTGTGSWTLAGLSTFSGGTTISGGTLFAGSNGALGTGNVSVLDSAINLTISTGISNAIGNGATLSLAGDGLLDNAAIAGYAFLAAGVNETVGGLLLGGIAQMDPGTYGATGSGATHIMDDYFQGTGVVTLVPEPSAGLALISGLGVLVGSRRMRRRS